ncbi:hypothetical protein KKF73_00980 [Patescibacteria group bacterium]|nr:hypothetical protein [Patescibacteria group bacterium]
MFTIADRLKILIQIAQIFHPDVNKTTELIQEIQKKMDVPEMFRAANSRLAPEGLTPPGEFAFSGFKLHLREYGHYLATILEGADGNYGISAEVRDRVTDNENVIIEPR